MQYRPGRPESSSGGLGELTPRGVEQTKQLSLGALHFLGGSQISLRTSPLLQVHQRHVRLQTSQPLRAELLEGGQRRLHVLMAIALDNLAFGADDVGGEHAGAVQIQPRIEHIFVERIDGFGELLRDVAVAHVLAHHAGIFALRQCVVVAVT